MTADDNSSGHHRCSIHTIEIFEIFKRWKFEKTLLDLLNACQDRQFNLNQLENEIVRDFNEKCSPNNDATQMQHIHAHPRAHQLNVNFNGVSVKRLLYDYLKPDDLDELHSLCEGEIKRVKTGQNDNSVVVNYNHETCSKIFSNSLPFGFFTQLSSRNTENKSNGNSKSNRYLKYLNNNCTIHLVDIYLRAQTVKCQYDKFSDVFNHYDCSSHQTNAFSVKSDCTQCKVSKNAKSLERDSQYAT
jgi:hypothetical protein